MMRLLRLLLPSVHALAISPITSHASLFDVQPFHSNISSNNTQSLNAMQVQCRAADPPFSDAIEAGFCGPAISIACRNLRAMARSHEREGFWNWVALTPERKCVAGFYVPSNALPWMFPSLDECHYLIFEYILYVCGRSQIGTANVDILPTSSTPGTPLEQGFPRYLMASEPL